MKPTHKSDSQNQCCIVGGGPAGIMLGFLLAKSGIRVTVLEKHADFFRDFRGDTIHPSTLEMLFELGLLEEFLALPHQEVNKLEVQLGDSNFIAGDFSHLPTHCKFIAFMPQWDFLNFISSKAKAFPIFTLLMEASVTDLIIENGRVMGVRYNSKGNSHELRSDLTIGADGRSSIVREKAALKVLDVAVPIDVLWFRVTRIESDPPHVLGRANFGKLMVMIDRGEYFQCAVVIPKGGYEQVKSVGLSNLQREVLRLAPFLLDRVSEIDDWEKVKLLQVTIDRLETWFRQGLLCIGDASHAMSPIGGVGINLAIQDAVAAARILAKPLQKGTVTIQDLKKVQARREFPTKVIQRGQAFVQNRVLQPYLGNPKPIKAPWLLKFITGFHFVQRLAARLIGVGIRPEHVRNPN